MATTISGTNGITTVGGYTGDGVVLADNTPANTLVTTTGGNVGIGTDAPTSRLSVLQPALDNNAFVLPMASSAANGNFTSIRGKYGVANEFCRSEIRFGVQSESLGTGFLAFATGDNTATERARIDSDGRLLVGATSIRGDGVVSAKGVSGSKASMTCDVDSTGAHGQMQFANPNGVVGTIVTSASSTAYNTTSDHRLKENVAPMTGALEKVAALKPCTYTWKTDGSQGQGFIAHELQEVVPDCVTGEKDAVDAEGNPQYQGVDTSFLVATLVAAIQELKAEVDALKGATP